jgi:hypothetical protein
MKTHLVLVIFFSIFSVNCFFPGAQGGASRGFQIYPADSPQSEQGSYTPLQRIKAYWRASSEGVTPRDIRREYRRGYTATAACQRWHRYSVDLVLLRQARIIRGADAVVGVRYGGYYRGGYRSRQLVCWAEGMVVNRGSDPLPQPSGFMKIRHCNRGRCSQWTRW